MKKLSITLLILLLSVPAFSQFLRFGIKAGAESSTAPKYDVLTSMSYSEAIARNLWNSIATVKNSSWGFHGGIFTRINIQTFYVQPEVVFTSNSFDYTIGIMDWSSDSYYKHWIKSQKFNRLSIPVLVGAKVGPLRFNAGPSATIQLSPKFLIDYSEYMGLGNTPNFDDLYKEVAWGFQAGLGIDILKKLTFDIRYAGSLGKKFGDTVTIFSSNSIKLDHSQKSFLVSLGFMF